MNDAFGIHPPAVWVIVPVFNEKESLPGFHKRITGVLRENFPNYVLCYVDDGSSDGTEGLIKGFMREDSHIRLLRLSRNFGHQAALTAGLEHASGNVVITMDGDGQHPPELIPQMIDLYKAGHELVLTKRLDGQRPISPKSLVSSLFYWLLSRLSETAIQTGSADFRLMSPNVLQVINRMPEYHRFLRGLVAWIGFNPVILPYAPGDRIGGVSRYSFRKMVKLALDAIFSFSLMPLWLGLLIGSVFILLAGVEGVYVLSFWLRGAQELLEPGWSSLMFMLLLVGGSTIVFVSIVGIYVGYILQEVKGRPVYVIQESLPGEELQED